jgi:hypothetical protein
MLIAPAIAALGVAVAIAGIVTIMYGISGCNPFCPAATIVPGGPVFVDPSPGLFLPPPDGSGITGGYGGGYDGSDQSDYLTQ